MSLVLTTNSLIQKLQDDGLEHLLQSVSEFYIQNDINILDLKAYYTRARGKYYH
jgi:hypothetical protein